jgi:hypothetical protein
MFRSNSRIRLNGLQVMNQQLMCTRSGSLRDNFGSVLIDYGLRRTTIYHSWIGSTKCATYKSRRKICTSFLGAPYTMRSEDSITASIRTRGAPSLLYFGIRTRDAYPSSSGRSSATDLNSYMPCHALPCEDQNNHLILSC